MNTTRDLGTFLEDQQRFLENKEGKIEQRKADRGNQEVEELYLQPKLDDLSVQIVEMMDERKGQTTYDRLYKKGYNHSSKMQYWSLLPYPLHRILGERR